MELFVNTNVELFVNTNTNVFVNKPPRPLRPWQRMIKLADNAMKIMEKDVGLFWGYLKTLLETLLLKITFLSILVSRATKNTSAPLS